MASYAPRSGASYTPSPGIAPGLPGKVPPGTNFPGKQIPRPGIPRPGGPDLSLPGKPLPMRPGGIRPGMQPGAVNPYKNQRSLTPELLSQMARRGRDGSYTNSTIAAKPAPPALKPVVNPGRRRQYPRFNNRRRNNGPQSRTSITPEMLQAAARQRIVNYH